jgi:hypothetical protein
MIIGEPVATNPVYLEIIDFFASGTTPQAVVDFQPSPAAQHRALELLDLAKEDRLTPEQDLSWSTSLSWSISSAWPKRVHARSSTPAVTWCNEQRSLPSNFSRNFRLIFRAVLRDEVECLPAAG